MATSLIAQLGLGTRQAAAQDTADSNTAGVLITVSATLAGIGTTVGIVYLVMTQTGKGSARGKAGRAMELYLQANSDQLVADLTLGTGRTVDDLASTAAISTRNAAVFGHLLRANRSELLDLADRQRLTPERALAFLERVGNLVERDGALVNDFTAGMAKYGQPA